MPLITPEEFAGMGRGIERHFTVPMSHYTPPVPKCLQYSQKLASFFLTQIFLGKGTVRLMVTVFDHCRCWLTTHTVTNKGQRGGGRQ